MRPKRRVDDLICCGVPISSPEEAGAGNCLVWIHDMITKFTLDFTSWIMYCPSTSAIAMCSQWVVRELIFQGANATLR